MPARVASADSSPCRTPLVSTQCKRHETRGSSINTQATPALAQSKRKFDLKITMLPNTQPGNMTSQEASLKTSFPVVEDEQEKKLVEVALSTAADPSHDLTFQGQPISPSMGVVMRYLTQSAPEQNCREFSGVRAEDFELIQRVIESGRLSAKPRRASRFSEFANFELTYDYNDLLLIVEMPTSLHEEPFDYLKEVFTLAIANLPYNRAVVRPRIHMNYRGSRSTPNQIGQPVMVADHNWCEVDSVQFFVWARDPSSDTPINVDDHDPQRMAYGTLMPYLEYGRCHRHVEFANITLPVYWDLAASGISSAVNTTAHQRYVDWFTRPRASVPEEQREPMRTRSRARGTHPTMRKLASSSSRKSKGKSIGVSKRAKASTSSMGDR
ncbi:uncharacterized protein HD556DRAFT_1309341 [Suillus plorans]|uniref:Uncharacterized protein n=1 Tax=Suillus plorans TaxID=116603 RepID=A0A9P7AM78_9AGAM|nr:uncharacterized protein HD556DRAFT_1309341 [Suillus plorans]KAG1792265.1 hypothetical protein HD556DRAFT_1309341 [Suillus plorans]